MSLDMVQYILVPLCYRMLAALKVNRGVIDVPAQFPGYAVYRLYLFERQDDINGEGERNKEVFHLFVHSPRNSTVAGQAKLEPGNGNCNQVSIKNSRDSSTWAIICCPPQMHKQEAKWESDQSRLNKHSSMDALYPAAVQTVTLQCIPLLYIF